jgi:MFS transporter, ACS family, hexuronate transporter
VGDLQPDSGTVKWSENARIGYYAQDHEYEFSLIIGVTADKIGFNPLFIAMGFFDLIGAFFLVTFIAERRAKRA